MSAPPPKKLRIGYIPEHFSTPLYFAQTHCNLNADLIPESLGTGALTARLKAPSTDPKAFDVAIGLTEGFVADLGRSRAAGKKEAGFGLVGTYVQSPLCWAISTGAERGDVQSVEDLRGKRVGVSRIGSGSYVMSYVLADSHGWLEPSKEPFGIEVIGDFAALRKSVRKEAGAQETEFFMWEHFTTKHFWDNGELKRIGEIYTPWPSWMIAAREPEDERLGGMFEAIDGGVKYYKQNKGEAVEYISTAMHYSKSDAEAWMETVGFVEDGVRGVKVGLVEETVKVLKKAGVLDEKAGDGREGMVAIQRS